MNEKLFHYLKTKPDLYESGEPLFWDDEHISEGMLEAHLDPEFEGTTRSLVFVFRSADRQAYPIEYRYMDYLKLDYRAEFDVATLIYCDYGVLSPEDRKIVANKVYEALKPDGIFILDTFTLANYTDYKEERKTAYRDSGFWSAQPHVLIQTNYRYPSDAFLEQYLVLTEHDLMRYHNWNQAFTPDTLSKELTDAGFRKLEVFGNVVGDPFAAQSDTVCIVCHK